MNTDKQNAKIMKFLCYPCLSVFIRGQCVWFSCFHRQGELANIGVEAGGFADTRPIFAEQRPEPQLGGFGVPRLHLLGAGAAQREIPAVFPFEPHEDHGHFAGQMVRGNGSQIILVDRSGAAAGGSRGAPSAAPGVGAQQPGHISDGPIGVEDTALGARRGGRRRAHGSMISRGYRIYRCGGALGLVGTVVPQPFGGSNGYVSGVTTTSVVNSSGTSFGGTPGPGNVSSTKKADHPPFGVTVAVFTS